MLVAISFLLAFELPFAFALALISLSTAISLAKVQVEVVITVELLSTLSMAFMIMPGLTALVAVVAVAAMVAAIVIEREGAGDSLVIPSCETNNARYDIELLALIRGLGPSLGDLLLFCFERFICTHRSALSL